MLDLNKAYVLLATQETSQSFKEFHFRKKKKKKSDLLVTASMQELCKKKKKPNHATSLFCFSSVGSDLAAVSLPRKQAATGLIET